MTNLATRYLACFIFWYFLKFEPEIKKFEPPTYEDADYKALISDFNYFMPAHWDQLKKDDLVAVLAVIKKKFKGD